MTTTPGASEAMTEARRLYLAFLPGRLRQIRPAQDADLIAAADHIDAQAAEIAALKAERDDAIDIAREQEDAHIAANMRCAEVGCERDALKAELATARNDAENWKQAADHWMNRALKGPTP